MTTKQRKLLDLLLDFDRICKKEGIRYYLCKETARSANESHSFSSESNQIDVAIMAGDALRFIDAVKKDQRADREVDSMYSNKNYPKFTLGYVDSGTTLITIPDYKTSQVPALAITVHIIRYKSSKANKFYSPTRSVWRMGAVPLKTLSGTAKRIIAVGIRAGKSVLGGKYLSRAIFKKWISLYKNKSSLVYIGDSKTEFPAAILEGQGIIGFEGREFNTFSNIEEYLTIEESGKVEKKVSKPSKNPDTVVFLSDYPYRDSVRKLKSYDTLAIRFKKLKHMLSLVQMSTCSGKINGYYTIVRRTQRRFEMHEKYMPMKAQIMQMYSEGRYEELKEILQPFTDSLREFYKKGLGLCFDKEIFDVTMKLLEKEGKAKYVNKLRRMVPEEHWKPMMITDYRGEPVEC